jgi:hypothetical protein
MRKLKFIILLFLIFSLNLFSQPDISGYLKFLSYLNIYGENKYLFERNGTRLQLKLSASSGKASFFTSVNIDAYKGSKEGLGINPVEFYIDLNLDFLKLRVGRQFVFWGKNEWNSPTDVIIPWDYENISSEIEDYRIPQTMIQGTGEFKGVRIQGIFNPVFTPNVISFQSTPFLQFEKEELPEKKISNSEFGGKIAFNKKGWDISLSFWDGFEKFPSIYFSFDPLQRILKGTPKYHRLRMLGFDMEKTWGSYGLKGEFSYNRTEDKDGKNIFIKNPHLKYLFGFDWLPTEKLNLQIQYLREELLKLNIETENQEWMKLQIPPKIPEKVTDYGVIITKWNPSDFVSFQLVNVRNLKSKDWLGLLLGSYEVQDALKLIGGLVLFEGKKGTTFGNLKDSSRFFLELKYSF